MFKCRICKKNRKKTVANLGYSALANAYLKKKDLKKKEKIYELKVVVCINCWLVQTTSKLNPKIIFTNEYAYLSSVSKSLIKHSKKFADKIVNRFNINNKTRVLEIACNDGYLLQFFKNISKCLGIEPTLIAANIAKKKGINVIHDFFSLKLAKKIVKKYKRQNFVIANNVIAHMDNVNDFFSGIKYVLDDNGIGIVEFHYALNLIEKKQFDIIYHEHYSYYSIFSLNYLLKKHKLKIFDIEYLKTQGGSLRVYFQHDNGKFDQTLRCKDFIIREKKKLVNKYNFYKNYQNTLEKIKKDFLEFLYQAKKNNKKVIGYGAAAKGNTLLNFSQVNSNLISFVVDNNKVKQNKYLPGSKIKILDIYNIKKFKPDYILILPWNIKDEIKKQLSFVKKWKCKFVVAIPKLRIE
ncbi:class I SAM-dependent methyltransferase [Candidatus Pelagibacter sp.]|nr:class I SAM-dependent methyltransferase [Candidatus Pelagibacter sp.]